MSIKKKKQLASGNFRIVDLDIKDIAYGRDGKLYKQWVITVGREGSNNREILSPEWVLVDKRVDIPKSVEKSKVGNPNEKLA